jgi:hypothetical protein
VRLAGLIAVVAGLIAIAPATAPATLGSATMFVHSAKGGEFRGGRLMLSGVGRQVTWVTNGGRSGLVSVARLHRRLFPPGTPAATGTLHIAGRVPGRGVALRLSRPRYNASGRRASYRAVQLSQGSARVARSGVPRRFGAASLSIIGAPAVLGGAYGGHDCSAVLLNHTLNDLGLVSSSKLPTDTWTDEIEPGTVVQAQTGIASWESSGGPLLGCSSTTVWAFAPNPTQPNPPSGTFTVTTTYPWTGPFNNTCASSNPRFTCRPASSKPGQVLWEIPPG